ncbi:MAG: MoxR family ATPase [Nanoarchaeota archaeon]|nr:MoxR family ATPase [Nanoarchaeota archaeon]
MKENEKKLSPEKVREAHLEFDKIRKEISKIVVGQEGVVDTLLRALLADGHVLVEGIPGIAKTLLIRALSVATGCEVKRIQFTVDLLPTDIVGITTYHEKKGFYTIKGPIFANFVIADEINRAPPKTQSAMLEAMEERQTTIARETFPMMRPFFVMATQNPIETAGVYPLPEAQIDRFLFWTNMGYPQKDEEEKILKQNIELKKFEEFGLKPVVTPKRIIELQNYAKDVYTNKEIEKYIIEVVQATRHPEKYGIKLGKYIEWGGSPRASIGLYIASKTDALLKGSNFVTPQNVKNVAPDVLRHRILLNYEGEAENIKTDDIISEILSKVPVP